MECECECGNILLCIVFLVVGGYLHQFDVDSPHQFCAVLLVDGVVERHEVSDRRQVHEICGSQVCPFLVVEMYLTVARLVDAISTPIPSKKSCNSDDEKKFPDLVIGSRYVPGGSTPGWPFKRRLISRAGGIFIRTVTGMPVRDPTGGFKCWRKTTLEKIDFTTVASAGYSFQLEMNHRTWKAGLSIKEIPIAFTDRVAGYSKITAGIAKESLKIAWRLHR